MTDRLGARLSRRDFLKVSVLGAGAGLLASCKVDLSSPTPGEPTPIVAPTSTEVEEVGGFISAEVLTKEEAFNDSLNTNEFLQRVFNHGVETIRDTAEAHAENSNFDLFVIKAKTTDGNHLLYPFITVEKTVPEGKTFVAMVFVVGDEIKIVSLEPTNQRSLISGEEYGTLSLTRDPVTEQKLTSPYPIFSIAGYTIEEFRNLNAEEQGKVQVLFSPYGYESAGEAKSVSTSGVRLARLISIATATPETTPFNPEEVDFERDTLYFYWWAEISPPRYGLPEGVRAKDMLPYNEFMTQVREIFPDAKNALVARTDTGKFGVIAVHIAGYYDLDPFLGDESPALLLQTWSADGRPVIFRLGLGGPLSPGDDGTNITSFGISTREDVLTFIGTHTDEYGEYLNFDQRSDQAAYYGRRQLRNHLKGKVVYLVVEFYPYDPNTDPEYQTGLWLKELVGGDEPPLGDNVWQGREFYDVTGFSLLIPEDAMTGLVAAE